LTSRRRLCEPCGPVDSKRNGSGPPPPPQRSGSFQWDEPSRGKSPDPASPSGSGFRFTDDDDDAQGAPEEAEELLEEVEEPEFVDSALIEEVEPAHGAPPPAPAPMPRGRERGAFLDDGEIALPPGLSQVVRTQSGSSFPFRDVTDDDDEPGALSGKFAHDDDDPDGADDIRPDGEADETWADAPVPTTVVQRAPEDDDFGDVHEPSRLTPPPRPVRDEDDFGDVLEPSRLTPVRAAASAPPSRPVRDEDDFGDVLEPSRLTPVRDAGSVPSPRPPRDEDDFGDVLEPSRAMRAARPAAPAPEPEYIDLRDSQSLTPPRSRDDDHADIRDSQSLVHDALDRSGLAPASDTDDLADLADDAPLPPPPEAALDLDGTAPPPLIAASAAQSGVGFSRAELERSYERLPIVRPPGTGEPTRPFSELRSEGHAPKASSEERAPVRGATGPLSDRDDDDAPTPGLAPVPSEPLGEPFPLDLWSDPDELIGRDLGRYRLVKPLSRGMMSRVYAAIDEESGRHVAIRILGPTHSPAEPRARQFLYEAQQLGKLHHESLVEVIDTGSTSDHLTYYVMERVDGESLAAVARNEGPLPWQQVGILITQICEALIVAADKNLHATDLNLGSVLRLKGEAEDNRGRQPIKLLGVGISPVASVYRSPDGNLVESKGTPPGTAETMAPEVASGGFPEPASVVYALGVMMYELLTGKPPFRGESFLAVIKKQMYDEPTPPSVVVPQQEIAGPFEAVLMQALAKDPSLRFPTVRDLHEAVLAARAQEGELRRATAILSLDPAFWDERSARKSEPHPASPPQPEPQPLASFAADLRNTNPTLAEAVLGPTSAARSEPVPAPRVAAVSEPRAIPIPAPLQEPPPPQPAAPAKPPKPEPSMILSQLAPPLRAPEPVALPSQAAAPMPLIVQLAQPPAPASNTFIRNLSLGIVAGSALIFLVLQLSRPATPTPRKTDPVAEGSGKRTKDTGKPRKQRDTRPRDEEEAPPIVVTAQPVPETRPTPPPETKIEPPPETKVEPPPETKVAPTLVPETKAEPTPPPETKTAPPPETKTAPPPETKTAPPPETKTAEPKPKPKPKPNVDPSLPQRIEPIRLKSRYASMEPRIAARCASMSGLGTASGLKVNVKIVVDTQGNVKATAQGNWTGTPLGRCVEDFVESIRFNETQHGGSRLHTFTF
jgi:serine/threonine protein kinase